MKTGRDVVDRRAARCRGVRLRHRPAGGVGLRHDARLPSRHLPGGDRHPEPRSCASASAGSPSSSRTSSSSSPRRCASTWPRSGCGPSRRPSGGSTSSTPSWPPSTSRPRASTCRRSWPSPRRAHPPTALCRQAQDHGLDRALDHQFLEACRPAIDGGRAGRRGAAHHQRGPDRGDPARLRDHHAPRWGGPPGRDHHPHLPGLGRPELRRLRARGA